MRHNTESQDGVLLVNSTATYFENDRILLEEAAVGNQPMSVMIQEGQYGLLSIHMIVQICESIQSDIPGFYYTERDVERWRHKTLFVMKSEMLFMGQH